LLGFIIFSAHALKLFENWLSVKIFAAKTEGEQNE